MDITYQWGAQKEKHCWKGTWQCSLESWFEFQNELEQKKLIMKIMNSNSKNSESEVSSYVGVGSREDVKWSLARLKP